MVVEVFLAELGDEFKGPLPQFQNALEIARSEFINGCLIREYEHKLKRYEGMNATTYAVSTGG